MHRYVSKLIPGIYKVGFILRIQYSNLYRVTVQVQLLCSQCSKFNYYWTLWKMSPNTYFIPKIKVTQCFIFGKGRCALLCWADWTQRNMWGMSFLLSSAFSHVNLVLGFLPADVLVLFSGVLSNSNFTASLRLVLFWCSYKRVSSGLKVSSVSICSLSHSMQFLESYCVPDLVLVTRLQKYSVKAKWCLCCTSYQLYGSSQINILRMAWLIPGGYNPSFLTVFRYFLMASLYPQFTRSFRILVTSAWSASGVLHVVIALLYNVLIAPCSIDCRWFEVELRYCPACVDFLLT